MGCYGNHGSVLIPAFSPVDLQVSRLKKELLSCNEDRDSAQLERDLLSNRFKHLESELESEKSVYTERTREVRGLEVSLVLKRGRHEERDMSAVAVRLF